MSSVYNTMYEMSYIPCAQPHMNASLSDGLATVNVDGRAISGGHMVDGKCYKGGYSTKEGGYIPGNNLLMFVGGFNPVKYSAQRTPVASTATVARLTRSNYL